MKKMLAIEKAEGLAKKRKPLSLIKKKPSRLTISLLSWQKQILSLLAKILEKLKKIITTNN